MSIDHQIITLEDNKKYFVLKELLEDRKEYCLILNIENENDIKITSKEQRNNKMILVEINDNELLDDLSVKFKESLKKEQEMYS